MRFTVSICTWNRAALLSQALEHFTRVQRPEGGWELLVVNNNCTDDTERVLDSFEGKLPLRRAFEPRQGLSHARNRAVEEAVGEYIAWTDDDTRVDEGWLAAYERAIEHHPEAAVFGGPIRPLFEEPPPCWLSSAWREVGDAFAARDLGAEPFELVVGKLPYGANYVVRAREQRQFPYDPALGRKLDGGAVGEETAVIRAILAAGGKGYWVPDARVEHWIPRKRQTIKYLRAYYELQGKTFVKSDGRSLRLWCGILRAESSYALARIGGDPRRWLKSLAQASRLRGSARR